MNSNEKVIKSFYSSFSQRDYKAMQDCYHPDIKFQDVAFELEGIKEVGAMWHMLCDREEPIEVILHRKQANDKSGNAKWDANYKFPDKTNGREIKNKIESTFEFKDGKIINHKDNCNVWELSKMAFGLPGVFLGWTPLAPKLIQFSLNRKLKNFVENKYQYQNNAQETQKLVDISLNQLRKSNSSMPKGQHPKQHGCVYAEFIVEKNLPAEYRVGLFSKEETFPAWIRFSNARNQNDKKGGGHGMAIKVMKVDGMKSLDADSKHKGGKTQDFVMFDHPVFFMKSIKSYRKFLGSLVTKLRYITGDRIKIINKIILSENEREESSILGKIRKNRIFSPLESMYWSAAPYKFGEGRAIKFFVKPTSSFISAINADYSKSDWSEEDTRAVEAKIGLNSYDEHYLRKVMSKQLEQQDAWFDFYIQERTDPNNMSIEDYTNEWNSTPVKVAMIRIPPQAFDCPEQRKLGEKLSFMPWHCLLEHEPLGGLNQARKAVYLATAEKRRKSNWQVSSIPEPLPNPWPPSLCNGSSR